MTVQPHPERAEVGRARMQKDGQRCLQAESRCTIGLAGEVAGAGPGAAGGINVGAVTSSLLDGRRALSGTAIPTRAGESGRAGGALLRAAWATTERCSRRGRERSAGSMMRG